MDKDYLRIFRNIYGFELKGERINYLAMKFDKVASKFTKEMKTFLSFLTKELKK
ncbi:MAG: hypothetical protein MRJ65_15955 [Candidatus Brocadiaceae bacterium]|nr:hypothetical protein [Candidatus Brocadiaceae bacterium]